jgi:hypothetical protein
MYLKFIHPRKDLTSSRTTGLSPTYKLRTNKLEIDNTGLNDLENAHVL